ncbi:zinc finger protein JACKDAW-like [Macadamia integrifolia]|uniref:zinc finger protein JACKDAW-like n=1 Tax=Macadamia integrifolia TaxID=60698 RepID=UPI001C533423|nr:zinc finger protein JACKDAW-like [Macadamia integrifolia]
MQMMSGDGLSIPTSIRGFAHQETNINPNPNLLPNPTPVLKKKRNLPGTPDPDAEVIALSPKTLMATNRFVCEICNKGFQRDQNLQLHRRGHNLPWKLRQRTSKEVRKRVYICPEKSCVHHDPSRALGDLTGIKKHFSRKHGEKKWKCEKCSKKYAVQSDWKAHTKTCGTREYKCDCGTLFSRKDSFITHRAFCDALAEESARFTSVAEPPTNLNFRPDSISDTTQSLNLPHGFGNRGGEGDGTGIPQLNQALFNNNGQQKPRLSLWQNHHHQASPHHMNMNPSLPELVQMASANLFSPSSSMVDYSGCMQPQPQLQWLGGSSTGAAGLSLSTSPMGLKEEGQGVHNNNNNNTNQKGPLVESLASLYSSTTSTSQVSSAPMSATALLQKAAQMGSTRSNNPNSNGDGSNPNPSFLCGFGVLNSSSTARGNDNNHMSNLMHSHSISNTAAAGHGGGVGGVMGNQMDHLMMAQQGQSVALKLHGVGGGNTNQVEHSLTRDFLGVGGDVGRPFLQQELVRFASSMGDISHHYNNGNH